MTTLDDALIPAPADEPESRPGGIPLYIWVLVAIALAVPTGLFLGKDASHFKLLADLIIRALNAVAAPLVVFAILSAILGNDVRGRQGARMMGFYLLNTLVAMLIALVLANVVQPGAGASLADLAHGAKAPEAKTLAQIAVELIPRSIGEALYHNNIAQLVLFTLAIGIGLAKLRNEASERGDVRFQVVIDLINYTFELLMKVLLWVVALVPLAVFGVVASSVGNQEGIKVFEALAWLIVVVVLGLVCQVAWYLAEMAVLARMSPTRFLSGARDVLASTFSTASTAATIPITLRALTGPLRVSRASSKLAACIGTNFNNDGTALYQAAAVMFLAQSMGTRLSLGQQFVVMLTTLFASVGAGSIPSGSFVTLPLIFAAVGLPPDAIPVLLTVDWFLDRCRTSSNVLGDMTVAVLIDRDQKPDAEANANA